MSNEDRNLHSNYLADIRCDVSQHPEWRELLFVNDENIKFDISSESVGDIFKSLAKNIEIYSLNFVVEKVSSKDMPCDEDEIVFKFYPKHYPDLVNYSFNNSISGKKKL